MKKPTISGLKAKAWKLVSEFVRRKDADEGGTVACYTCGRLMFWKEAHAGHALPGRHNAVLLDVDVMRVQCPVCNIWKGGMYHVFTTKLIKENGMSWWEQKLEGSRRVLKLTRSDWEQAVEHYKQKLELLG